MMRYGSRKQVADDLGVAELLPPLKPIGFESRVFVAAYARTKLVKTTRFSDAQIMATLKLAECGVPVTELCREHGMSSAAFYRWRAVSIREAHDRYDPKLRDENAVIEDWRIKLTDSRKRWEFGLCFVYLRNVKGVKWNHKRVRCIYCELDLNLRIKCKRPAWLH